jgi:hypothetical protein
VVPQFIKNTGKPHSKGVQAGIPRKRSEYRDTYERFKALEETKVWMLEDRGGTLTKGEIVPAWLANKRSIRKVGKLFMKHLWKAYKRLQDPQWVDKEQLEEAA